MLKENGLFVFSCAGFGRPKHGTRKTTPNCSYGTIHNMTDMQDYYKNLTIKDINNVLDLNEKFISWNSYYNLKSKDLYFIGIKKGTTNVPIAQVPDYISDKVFNNKMKI
jgi:hypothetical protein